MRRSVSFDDVELRQARVIAASRGQTTNTFVEEAVHNAIQAGLPECLALLNIRPGEDYPAHPIAGSA